METPNTTATVEVEAGPKLNVFPSDVMMVILTWVTFFCLLVLLHKFAWKPILAVLKKREDDIRQALDNADQAKAQLESVGKTKQQILEEAKVESAQIILQARQSAAEVAIDIEKKAKVHAQEILNSAHAQIAGERQRVTQDLKREAIDTAIHLAEKVLKENLDMDKNRKLMQEAVNKDMAA